MAAASVPSPERCRLGVLAFGDSITNGGGELQWGVALQSWALWVARGLGLPFTSFAVDGAIAEDVVSSQIPAHRKQTAVSEPRYHLGCLYIGVNDVRRPDWDASAYDRDLRAGLEYLDGICTRTLTALAPLDVGRPRVTETVREANAVVAAAARDAGALVLDLSGFGARNLVMTDHVHPTAFGQVNIAERALAVLAADGCPALTRPSSLIDYHTTWFGQLRGDATYAYRRAKVAVRAVQGRIMMP